MKTKFTFDVVLEPQPDGGFTVLVPALPEVVTEGETEDEAMHMAEEAIQLAVEYRLEQGEAVISEPSPKLRRITVAVAA